MNETEIYNLRSQIDELDREILRLIDKRAALSCQISKLKIESGITTYSPERELDIISTLIQNYNGRISKNSISIIFKEIISACREVDNLFQILLVGEPYSLSHDASVKLFGGSISIKALDSANEVINLLKRDSSKIVVFPIIKYNSEVNTLIDSLFYNEFYVVFSYLYLPKFSIISAFSDDITNINKIFATRESLNLVKFYSLPISFQGEIKICYSNQEVVENLVETLPNAGLLPANIAKSLVCKTIYSDLEPPNNTHIRFLVLSKTNHSDNLHLTKFKNNFYNESNTLILATRNNHSLNDILKILMDTNFLVTSIDTYPVSSKPYDNIIIIDFMNKDENSKSNINKLKSLLNKQQLLYKILNSYFQLIDR